MISDVFREILDDYEAEKRNDFKNNIYVSNFRKEVPASILSNIADSFSVKASCGYNTWCDYPWISIIHKRFDNHHESMLIEYRFDSRKSEVSLSLIPRLEDYSEYVSIKKKLRDIIEKLHIYTFEVSDEDSFSIVSKKYSYDELDNFTLVSDLEYIINIHEKLVPYFKAFINDDGLEEKRFNQKITHEEELFKQISTYEDLEFNQKIECENALYELEKKCDSELSENYSLPIKPSISSIRPDYERKNTYIKSINEPENFFSDKIINEIRYTELTNSDYSQILESIRNDYTKRLDSIIRDNNLSLDELSIKEKVLLFSKSFVDTEYKSIGKQLGSYSFNKIRVDDRLSDPLIITSLIHELSHYILERILKEALMKILRTNDTPLISSFIKILLEDNDLNYLMDEYCAHTVEGRFALFGYQDYSSFKYKLDEISHLYSKDDIEFTLVVANTFAYDIKDILEDFLNENLRQEIKEEFLHIADNPNYEALDLEIESRLNYVQIDDEIKFILTSGFGESVSQMEKLQRYMAKYDKLLK